MKTIEEIAIECASMSGYSYTNVENFKPHNWVLNAMQQYAKQCCDMQIDKCRDQIPIKYMYSIEVRDLILHTPNVVKP